MEWGTWQASTELCRKLHETLIFNPNELTKTHECKLEVSIVFFFCFPDVQCFKSRDDNFWSYFISTGQFQRHFYQLMVDPEFCHSNGVQYNRDEFGPGPGLSKAIFGVWPTMGLGLIIFPRPGPVFGFENWRGSLAQIVAHGPNFFLSIFEEF